MKGEEYEKLIERLDLSKVEAAKFFAVDYTTSKRWMYNHSPIPLAVQMLLRVMVKYKLTVADVLSLIIGKSK
jgi:hypothetical protein